MHYPWWYVPFLTSPMLIAIISVLHILVAHYAVGGGWFLAVEVRHAYKTDNKEYLEYLYDHARFFILITVVFGAITGVAVWWIIGLASPLATETLIHTFVFAWACEYVFFIIELTAAYVFYYGWGRLSPQTHITIGFIYAIAAWMSLFIITAILGFMLHPGEWLETRSFWSAFFNPQFFPQLVSRTGGAIVLSTLYVYLHASFRAKNAKLRNMIEQRSARAALVGSVLVLAGGFLWYVNLPESALAHLTAASALNIFMALLHVVTIGIMAMLYFGPVRNPGWLTPGFAIMLFVAGLAAMSIGEFVREAVRKPYVIYNVVMSNQIRAEDIDRHRRNGYLESGVWTSEFVRTHYPQAIDDDGRIDEAKLVALPKQDRLILGEVLFQYHCNDCHNAREGHSAMGELLRGWDRDMIASLTHQPEKYHSFMPPWCGTKEEEVLMVDYLVDIAPPLPAGMMLGERGPQQ